MSEREPEYTVFKQPIKAEIWDEDGRFVIERHDAMAVGVAKGEDVVYHKEIYPFFMSIRTGAGVIVSKPFYPARIRLAEKQAQRIAKAYEPK